MIAQLTRDRSPWIAYRPAGEDTYSIGTDDGTQRRIASGLTFALAVQIVDEHQILYGFADIARLEINPPSIVDTDGKEYFRSPLL